MNLVRAPAAAGAFYPGTHEALQARLSGLLASARGADGRRPKALIAPHAGYAYSGSVAASAYACLGPHRNGISRVIVLGPAHRLHLRGLALPEAVAFATPLGEIPLDSEAVKTLRTLPQIRINDQAHALEHSIEVQLPFLQLVLASFTLVPLAVGDASVQEVGEVIDLLWGGTETLIVVSSDLSHYLPYSQARQVDERTTRMVLDLAPRLGHDQACGATPVNGLLQVAGRRGLRTTLLDGCNSGDTAGDKNRVVGYASFAFYDHTNAEEIDLPADDLGVAHGRLLIAIARSAIADRFGLRSPATEPAVRLRRPGACFVTLKKDGRLRGCIGSLVVQRSLVDDVRVNACAAAFQDPRFEPLRLEELHFTHVEISVLSAQLPMSFFDQEDALAQLRPQIDGVVLEFGGQRGTFLPQVWETLPEPRRFLAELKRKTGLAPDFWDPGIHLYRYTVTKWAEPEMI